MDPKHKVAAILVRIRTATGFHGVDLLSCWGYQGNCKFNTKSLEHLVELEEMGVWFNKVVQEEEPKTPHPWSDYLLASEKFLRGEFANPPTTDYEHLHLMDSPRSFYAIADMAFKKGFFKSDAAKAAFALFSPPGSQKPKKSPLPPALQSKGDKARTGVPFPTSSSTGVPSSLQPPPKSTESMPPPKPLVARVKEKLSKHKANKDQYQMMVENSHPLIPGSKVLLNNISSQVSPTVSLPSTSSPSQTSSPIGMPLKQCLSSSLVDVDSASSNGPSNLG